MQAMAEWGMVYVTQRVPRVHCKLESMMYIFDTSVSCPNQLKYHSGVSTSFGHVAHGVPNEPLRSILDTTISCPDHDARAVHGDGAGAVHGQ